MVNYSEHEWLVNCPTCCGMVERLGITPHCLLRRKELGWDIERILTTPLKGGNNGKAKL